MRELTQGLAFHYRQFSLRLVVYVLLSCFILDILIYSYVASSICSDNLLNIPYTGRILYLFCKYLVCAYTWIYKLVLICLLSYILIPFSILALNVIRITVRKVLVVVLGSSTRHSIREQRISRFLDRIGWPILRRLSYKVFAFIYLPVLLYAVVIHGEINFIQHVTGMVLISSILYVIIDGGCLIRKIAHDHPRANHFRDTFQSDEYPNTIMIVLVQIVLMLWFVFRLWIPIIIGCMKFIAATLADVLLTHTNYIIYREIYKANYLPNNLHMSIKVLPIQQQLIDCISRSGSIQTILLDRVNGSAVIMNYLFYGIIVAAIGMLTYPWLISSKDVNKRLLKAKVVIRATVKGVIITLLSQYVLSAMFYIDLSSILSIGTIFIVVITYLVTHDTMLDFRKSGIL